MRIVIFFFIIIIIVIAVISFSNQQQLFKKGSAGLIQLPTEEKEISEEKPPLTQKSPAQNPQKPLPKKQTLINSTKPEVTAEIEKPTISVNTKITAGPKEGELIEETNKVVFEFEGDISPKETKGRLFFETKIEGFDEDWKKTYYQRRVVELPPGPKEYTFLVRAKVGGLTDPSPAKRTFKINTSPYFGKVKISRFKPESYNYPSLIGLSSRLKKEEEINITGWQIKGKKGGFTIPQAIENYLPGYNPTAKKDVLLSGNQIIYLINAPSPLGGNKNFRLNKCFGYLKKSSDFYPSFSASCPRSNKLEDISYLNEYCQEFILHIRSCEIPDYSEDWKIMFDLECRDYIDEHFNYYACFKNHSKDEDFLKNYWYVYFSYNIVSQLHDTLYLRDRNNLLVDKYLY